MLACLIHNPASSGEEADREIDQRPSEINKDEKNARDSADIRDGWWKVEARRQATNAPKSNLTSLFQADVEATYYKCVMAQFPASLSSVSPCVLSPSLPLFLCDLFSKNIEGEGVRTVGRWK